jgi:hypothetical protein
MYTDERPIRFKSTHRKELPVAEYRVAVFNRLITHDCVKGERAAYPVTQISEHTNMPDREQAARSAERCGHREPVTLAQQERQPHASRGEGIRFLPGRGCRGASDFIATTGRYAAYAGTSGPAW